MSSARHGPGSFSKLHYGNAGGFRGGGASPVFPSSALIFLNAQDCGEAQF
jgi:hypothetical protein